MGFRWFDQYSLLHAAVGVVAYFWSVPFWPALFLHVIFEFVENSEIGIHFIQFLTSKERTFRLPWPGGKTEPDSISNMMGDNITFATGWLVAAYLDFYGKAKNWYYRTTDEY
jgi:hypothetical protein